MPASDLTQPIAYAAEAEPTHTLPAVHRDGTACRVGGQPGRAGTAALVVLVLVLLAAVFAVGGLAT